MAQPRTPSQMLGFRIDQGSLATREPTNPDALPDLPSLMERGTPLDAWREWAAEKEGPHLVRFEEAHRSHHIPLDQVQRLARLAPLWVDAAPEGEGDVMDLAFAGAERVVVWHDQVTGKQLEDWLEGMEGAVVFAIDTATSGTEAVNETLEWAENWGGIVLVRGMTFPDLSDHVAGGKVPVYLLTDRDGAWSLHMLAARIPEEDLLEDGEE